MSETKTLYVVSDSIGETAEKVAKATISQFDQDAMDIVRIPFVRHTEQIRNIIEEAASNGGVICHTLVSQELRDSFEKIAREEHVQYVDILGPMLNMVSNVTDSRPRMKPGIIHRLDQEYFKRVAAIEFAVKYDDGKNPSGFKKADVVLVGVSRTSKTPLSMYLEVPPYKVIGLIIDPFKLNTIRTERIKALGFSGSANYTDLSRIQEELMYAKEVMRRLHCMVIDVSNKAIEETASRIIEIIEKNKQLYGNKY